MGAEQVLVIGAGVAGVSAALWLRDLGVDFAWWERGPQLGGVLREVFNPIRQHVGGSWPDGAALCATLEAQASAQGIAPERGVAARRVSALRGASTVEVEPASGAPPSRWGAVIVATGTARRQLNLPGEAEHTGRGVLRSGIAGQERLAGRRVVIVGGGDAALENVVILSRIAAHVTLVHWSDRLRARPEFIDAARSAPNVTFRLWSTVTRLDAEPGAPFLKAVYLQGPSDAVERLEADALLVRIGVTVAGPALEIDGAAAPRDGSGYFIVDSEGRTPHPRLFAAGDCTCPLFRSVPTSAGQGAWAAQAAARLLGYYG